MERRGAECDWWIERRGARVSTTGPDLLAANSAFYEALEQGDLDALTALWVDGDEAVCVHPGLPPIHGAKAVMRS